MKRKLVQALEKEVEGFCDFLNKPKQEKKYPRFLFSVREIIPLSEFVAVALLDKSDGQRALVLFYWSGWSGEWRGFMPKESHVFGFEKVRAHLQGVEEHNFSHKRARKGERLLEEFV